MRLILTMVVFAALAAGQARSVALTFDDLPLAGQGDARRVNRAILAALARRRAPAIGFVNERGIRKLGDVGQGILHEWLRRGQELGNHLFSHPDLNGITVDQFRREVIDGEASIGRPRFLRFPHNHTGDTREKHDAVAAFLAGRGYTVAPCTIDNSDFEFARAYESGSDRGAVRARYVAYTAAEIDYYTQLHVKALGREIPHVMLLHANRLNADVMDRLLGLFEKRGYRFVTLAEALADPAYSAPDTYVTKYGPMWGYRWARQLGVTVDGRLEPEPPQFKR
jgi:peptidoglycan/xylan/chitin deacetylase (PgdA/CDA1 family)